MWVFGITYGRSFRISFSMSSYKNVQDQELERPNLWGFAKWLYIKYTNVVLY